MNLRPFAALLLLATVVAAPVRASTAHDLDASVETHAHLFMKEGLSWFFRGDFNGPLQATSWRDRFSSQANPEALERSDLGIVVAALYAHPLLVGSLRDSIRKQLDLADRFVHEHPDWVIARSAADARRARAAGKHVMILALEGASGILESDQDLAEFVDRRGISIVTYLHLTDDEFGGVAFLEGYRALADPWAFLSQLFHPSRDRAGRRVNERGLTAEGRAFAEKLLAHHVWIDLSHASDASQRELIPILEKAGQPLLYTHTILRKYHGAERGISQAQLAEVAKSGGIVGLMPSDEYLNDTKVEPRFCPKGCTPAQCSRSVHALAQQYAEAVAALGPDSVVMGSDYNGGLPHLSPSCGTGTALDREGLWNMGEIPELWKALRALGAPVPAPLSRTVDRFLSAWGKVRP